MSEIPGIIVGVDGSVHSQWALDWAISEAVPRHATLTVLSVHHQRAGYTEGDPSLDQVVEEVETLVDKAVSRRSGPVPPIIVAVTRGSPGAELLRAARDAELLVVGSRGNGGLGRLGTLGSVSNRLAHEARCQVMIISQPSGVRLA